MTFFQGTHDMYIKNEETLPYPAMVGAKPHHSTL
jgi:hypothetical protein